MPASWASPAIRDTAIKSATKRESDVHVDPATWAAATPKHDGSWWTAWVGWLQQHSSGKVQPPPLGAPQAGYPAQADAPGRYVLEH